MPKSTLYKEFNHYPKGKAKVSLQNKRLHVTSLNEYQDGIMIDTKGKGRWRMKIQPINFLPKTIVGATYFLKDKIGKSRAVSQWVIIQSPDSHNACLLFNSKLNDSIVSIKGKFNGLTKCYRNHHAMEVTKNGWKIAASFDISSQPLSLFQMEYETKFVYDNQGKLIDIEQMKTFGINGYKEARSEYTDIIKDRLLDQIQVTSSLKSTIGSLRPFHENAISKIILNIQGVAGISTVDDVIDCDAVSLIYNHSLN